MNAVPESAAEKNSPVLQQPSAGKQSVVENNGVGVEIEKAKALNTLQRRASSTYSIEDDGLYINPDSQALDPSKMSDSDQDVDISDDDEFKAAIIDLDKGLGLIREDHNEDSKKKRDKKKKKKKKKKHKKKRHLQLSSDSRSDTALLYNNLDVIDISITTPVKRRRSERVQPPGMSPNPQSADNVIADADYLRNKTRIARLKEKLKQTDSITRLPRAPNIVNHRTPTPSPSAAPAIQADEVKVYLIREGTKATFFKLKKDQPMRALLEHAKALHGPSVTLQHSGMEILTSLTPTQLEIRTGSYIDVVDQAAADKMSERRAIQVKLVKAGSQPQQVKIFMDQPLSALIDAAKRLWGPMVSLLFDDEPLEPSTTANDLDMEDEDQVDVIIR